MVSADRIQGGHDDAEVVVQARDRVLGGVDDDVVLVAGHAAGEEGADALVQGDLDANSCRYSRRHHRG